MPQQTIHIMQSFMAGNRGVPKPDKPVSCKSPEEAKAKAERLAGSKLGVVAFSQTGDSDLGDFDEPVVLFRAGTLPASFED